MRLSMTLLLLLLLAACSNKAPTPGESAPPATRLDAPTQQALPASSSAAPRGPAIGWRWNHALREVEKGTPLRIQLRKDRVFLLEGGWDPDRLALQRQDDTGAVLWRVEIKPDFVATATIAAYKNWLIVVRHSAISSGGTLLVFDQETGQQIHAAALHALGGVSHSKYSNEIQVQILNEKIVVFGMESQGNYVEVYEPGSWKRVSNTRVEDRLTSLRWQWNGPARTSFRAGPNTLKLADAIYRYEPGEQPAAAALIKRSLSGEELWRRSFPGEGSCGTAAMLEHDSRLFALQYCSIASGAQLMVFDSGSGVLQYKRELIGLGPIAHSEYWNDVELQLLHEHVVIFGKEAAGRYIEVIAPDTGAMIALRSFLEE